MLQGEAHRFHSPRLFMKEQLHHPPVGEDTAQSDDAETVIGRLQQELDGLSPQETVARVNLLWFAVGQDHERSVAETVKEFLAERTAVAEAFIQIQELIPRLDTTNLRQEYRETLAREAEHRTELPEDLEVDRLLGKAAELFQQEGSFHNDARQTDELLSVTPFLVATSTERQLFLQQSDFYTVLSQLEDLPFDSVAASLRRRLSVRGGWAAVESRLRVLRELCDMQNQLAPLLSAEGYADGTFAEAAEDRFLLQPNDVSYDGSKISLQGLQRTVRSVPDLVAEIESILISEMGVDFQPVVWDDEAIKQRQMLQRASSGDDNVEISPPPGDINATDRYVRSTRSMLRRVALHWCFERLPSGETQLPSSVGIEAMEESQET